MEENTKLPENQTENTQEQENQTENLTIRELFKKIGDIKAIYLLYVLVGILCLGMIIGVAYCFVESFCMVIGRDAYSYKFWDADLLFSIITACFFSILFGMGLGLDIDLETKPDFWPTLFTILFFVLFVFTIEYWDYMNIYEIELYGVSNSLLGGISLGLLIFISLFCVVANDLNYNSDSSDSSENKQETVGNENLH